MVWFRQSITPRYSSTRTHCQIDDTGHRPKGYFDELPFVAALQTIGSVPARYPVLNASPCLVPLQRYSSFVCPPRIPVATPLLPGNGWGARLRSRGERGPTCTCPPESNCNSAKKKQQKIYISSTFYMYMTCKCGGRLMNARPSTRVRVCVCV